ERGRRRPRRVQPARNDARGARETPARLQGRRQRDRGQLVAVLRWRVRDAHHVGRAREGARHPAARRLSRHRLRRVRAGRDGHRLRHGSGGSVRGDELVVGAGAMAATRVGKPMPESVYKIIELVGTSTDSWEKAAKAAVEKASKTLRDLRVAEISTLDMHLE